MYTLYLKSWHNPKEYDLCFGPVEFEVSVRHPRIVVQYETRERRSIQTQVPDLSHQRIDGESVLSCMRENI